MLVGRGFRCSAEDVCSMDRRVLYKVAPDNLATIRSTFFVRNLFVLFFAAAM